MKETRKQFTKKTMKNNDFVASNYLSNMLSEEEFTLMEKIDELKALKG